ncbi:hypothetical protein HanRHA438_Chr11g0484421 [Helianthus annuus]|nr:hypothetical protein HanIR_Chr11g0507321 [Helianthus annuus]KAJ0869007.1 hypothetical protein HanRHA438_Chr11g0484421 [Helianthus annuus]
MSSNSKCIQGPNTDSLSCWVKPRTTLGTARHLLRARSLVDAEGTLFHLVEFLSGR